MLFAFAFLTMLGGAQAQTPTPTPVPLSEEQQELNRQLALEVAKQGIAEAKAKRATAEKADREAQFPTGSTTPLAGTTTINDGVVIETQMVAYISMARAANKIIAAISTTGNFDNLAIFHEADVKLLLSHKVALKQLEVLRLEYGQLLSDNVIKNCLPKVQSNVSIESVPAGFQIAKSFLGAFVDLTALLRTNVDIKGQSFDIDETPLVSEVFRSARCRYGQSVALYYPGVFPPDVDATRDYEILGELQLLHCLRVSAAKLITDIEKNEKSLGESEAKVKTITAAIEDAGAARVETEKRMRNLLKGYCPRFPTDAPLIDGLNGNLRQFCPGLSPEKRVDIFELRDRLVDLVEQLSGLATKLKNEKVKTDALKEAQKTLWAKLREDLKVTSAESADDMAAQLKALNEQFDRMIASFVQVETATGVNQLTMFIKAENLKAALAAKPGEANSSNGTARWLQLKVIKAGGNNRIKTNLIWDIFTGGNRVSHSGGAIVEYILYDTSGRSLASDTVTEYTNYIKAGKVKNLSDYTVDNPGCPCKADFTVCTKENK
jgi:hypothetical protein